MSSETAVPEPGSPGVRYGVKTAAMNEHSWLDICTECGQLSQSGPLRMGGTAHLMPQGPAWRVEDNGGS